MVFISYIADLFRGRLCFRQDYDMLDIATEPEKTIRYVELDYSCNFKPRAFAWLCADSTVSDIRYLVQKPCRWDLNLKVKNLTLISTAQLPAECVKASVVYEELKA